MKEYILIVLSKPSSSVHNGGNMTEEGSMNK